MDSPGPTAPLLFDRRESQAGPSKYPGDADHRVEGHRRVAPSLDATAMTVTFELGPNEVSYHGPDMKRVVEPGRFQVIVDGSSADVTAATLDVVGP
jgi:hypothetical protein